jgi:hypothetical protein
MASVKSVRPTSQRSVSCDCFWCHRRSILRKSQASSRPTIATSWRQECYLRAFRYFDTFVGSAMKPLLFAILRNVCLSQRAISVASADRGMGDFCPRGLWSGQSIMEGCRRTLGVTRPTKLAGHFKHRTRFWHFACRCLPQAPPAQARSGVLAVIPIFPMS